MYVLFDDVKYKVSDNLFLLMVIKYKHHIGYEAGQRINYPMLATQSEAMRIVDQVNSSHGLILHSLDHRVAIANAVMRAV